MTAHHIPTRRSTPLPARPKKAKHFRLCIAALCLTLSAPLYAAEEAAQLHTFRHTAADGIERPYVLYTPPQHGDGQKRTLIVHLHGAISRPQISTDPEAAARRSPVLKLTQNGCCYVLFPYGQQGAGWFDETGTEMVMAQIDRISRDFPVDTDKIFLSGFSDGASGTFYFAATRPERFAGFIALNGSLPVAAHLGAQPLYPANSGNKPFYIVNTDQDILYPAAAAQPIIAELSRHNRNITFKTPAGGHDMRYLDSYTSELSAFIADNRRQTPHRLDWQGGAGSGTEWLQLLRLQAENTPPAPWHVPYSLRLRNEKAGFGIRFDNSYQQGLKIAGFAADSSAEKMGARPGDIILKMGDIAIDNPYAGYRYLGNKRAGDEAELTVLRDGREIRLNGRFNEGYEYEVFEKQPFSGRIRAQLDGSRLTVETSRVAAFAVDFDKLGVSGQELTLVLNGRARPIQARGRQEFTVGAQ